METLSKTSAESDVHPQVRHLPTRYLPGEEGIWVLVCGDLMIFSLLFGAFLMARSDARALFSGSQALLDSNLALFNTCLLLTSSWFIAVAVRLAKAQRMNASVAMLHGTILCGFIFAIVKIYEYSLKISLGITPNSNEFFMLYYVITGMHLAHVIIGMAFLFWISTRVRESGRAAGHVRLLEVGATFWHFVDVVWIIIFPLLYLAN